MIQGNFNDKIWVRLTETGKKILKDSNEKWKVPNPDFIYIEELGYNEFHLWELMQIFGEHVGQGFDDVFEKSIIYYTNPL
jgi:hypothetical protein